jgi:hypothetical protein
MHGGAVTLARLFLDRGFQPDLLLATDMLDLTTFLALTRGATAHLPAVLYMHENQLTYPLPGRREHGADAAPERGAGPALRFRQLCLGFAACRGLQLALPLRFVFPILPAFLKHFPDEQELPSTVEALRAKSRVLPVGVNLARLQPEYAQPAGGQAAAHPLEPALGIRQEPSRLFPRPVRHGR